MTRQFIATFCKWDTFLPGQRCEPCLDIENYYVIRALQYQPWKLSQRPFHLLFSPIPHILSSHLLTYLPLQSAKVYSYDIWSKHFAKDPFNKRAARRYRKIVLEHHDTPVYTNPLKNLSTFLISKLFHRPRTHMEALTKFMGRKPDSRAFIKALKAPASRNQTFWRRMGIRLGIKDGF
jgi:hypothetical protein